MNYEEGYKLTKRNFKTLYKSAKQAELNGFFGLACSLNILASEELIKALFIFVKSRIPDTEITNFDKIFRDHKTKHKELKNYLKSADENIRKLSFNVLEDKKQFLQNLPKEHLAEFEKEYKDVERVNKRTRKILQTNITIDQIFTWLDFANNDKNKGLYVNLNNDGNWNTPENIKKEKFKIEKKYTKILYLHLKNSVDITEFLAELKIRKEKRNTIANTV